MQCTSQAAGIPNITQLLKHNLLVWKPLDKRITAVTWRQQIHAHTTAHSNSSRRQSATPAAAEQETSSSPPEVTILIKDSDDYHSLAAVVRNHQPVFNFIHAAAAFTHAAQLTQQLIPGDQRLLQQQQFEQQNVGNNIVQQHQHHQQLQELTEVLPLLLQSAQQQIKSFQGRQVANCVWAANKLLYAVLKLAQQQQEEDAADCDQALVPLPAPEAAAVQLQQQLLLVSEQLLQQAANCWHLFTGQELVLLLYAVTSMPPEAAVFVASGATSSSSSSSINSNREVHGADVLPPAAGLHVPEAAAAVSDLAWANTAIQQLQKLHRANKLRLKPQEFEMLMISLRKLMHHQQQQQQNQHQQGRDSSQLQQQQQQPELRTGSNRQRRQQHGQWSDSSQQQRLQMPMMLLQQLLSATADKSHRCSSRDIAGILYSAASLGLKPTNAVVTKLLTPLGLGSKTLRSCNSADVTNILYALAVLRSTPQQQQHRQDTGTQAIRGLVVLLLQQHQQFAAAELAVCVYALARLRVRLPAAAVSLLAAAAVQRLQPQQQQELVLLLWGSAAAGARLKPVVIQAVLVKYLTGCAAAAAAAAAAGSGMQPFASASTSAATNPADLQQHEQQLAAQHISMVFWSLGKIGYCSPKLLLLPLLQLSHSLLTHSGSEHLACLCWGLAKIGLRPSRVWLSGFYEQLLWLAGQPNPDVMLADEGFVSRDLTAQTLAMIVWGLVQLKVAQFDASISASPAAAAAAAAGSEADTAVSAGTDDNVTTVDVLHRVISMSQSVLQSCPLAVGVTLWGCVKLGFAPEPNTLESALQAFSSTQIQQQRGTRQQGQHGNRRQQQGGAVPRQQQQQQRWSMQQQRRYTQSLALSVWALAKLGTSEDLKQQVTGVLWANVQQLRWFSPMDLTTIIWGLNQLQLRPPTPWLLNFYINSQSRFEQFTDVRLASLVVPLHALLQRRPGDGGSDGQQHQHQVLSEVPPAVWLLQLELQVQSRWKRRQRKGGQRIVASEAVANEVKAAGNGIDGARAESEQQEAAEQVQQDQRKVYDPLRLVAGVLRKWRAASLGTSVAAAVQQLPVVRESAVT